MKKKEFNAIIDRARKFLESGKCLGVCPAIGEASVRACFQVIFEPTDYQKKRYEINQAFWISQESDMGENIVDRRLIILEWFRQIVNEHKLWRDL